ncbi:hypothetical protein [Sulfitobacter dubius]|uniref:hypothetical protein n=1 Tax=Sulfitobacter dubius TaxID=218673 RepID=UPI0030DD6EA3|tara:strand:+ start:78 stop:341 length:264 start_codon:yes stop_codon:yes gene_type:complete
MINVLTFGQALKMASSVECLVRGPDSLVPIRISKAAACRDYGPAVKGHRAKKTASELDGSIYFAAADEKSGATLWTFDPSDQVLLIG